MTKTTSKKQFRDCFNNPKSAESLLIFDIIYGNWIERPKTEWSETIDYSTLSSFFNKGILSVKIRDSLNKIKKSWNKFVVSKLQKVISFLEKIKKWLSISILLATVQRPLSILQQWLYHTAPARHQAPLKEIMCFEFIETIGLSTAVLLPICLSCASEISLVIFGLLISILGAFFILKMQEESSVIPDKEAQQPSPALSVGNRVESPEMREYMQVQALKEKQMQIRIQNKEEKQKETRKQMRKRQIAMGLSSVICGFLIQLIGIIALKYFPEWIDRLSDSYLGLGVLYATCITILTHILSLLKVEDKSFKNFFYYFLRSLGVLYSTYKRLPLKNI